MGQQILYNNKLYPSDAPLITVANRGFRYGDGLFETMKVKQGVLLLGSFHFERLWDGLRSLRFITPAHFTPAFLEQEVMRLCFRNGESALARVRLNLFRGEGGVNDPVSHAPQYIIETWALERAFTPAQSNGLDLGVFPEGRKAIDAYSNLKTNNYQVYLQGALWAKEQRLNECLILNSHNRVADASISNVFYVKDGVVYTPALTEGGVAGVLRRYLINELPGLGITVREVPVSPEALEDADEIFLSNAITGIRWVKSFQGKKYAHPLSARISNTLEARFA